MSFLIFLRDVGENNGDILGNFPSGMSGWWGQTDRQTWLHGKGMQKHGIIVIYNELHHPLNCPDVLIIIISSSFSALAIWQTNPSMVEEEWPWMLPLPKHCLSVGALMGWNIQTNKGWTERRWEWVVWSVLVVLFLLPLSTDGLLRACRSLLDDDRT